MRKKPPLDREGMLEHGKKLRDQFRRIGSKGLRNARRTAAQTIEAEYRPATIDSKPENPTTTPKKSRIRRWFSMFFGGE